MAEVCLQKKAEMKEQRRLKPLMLVGTGSDVGKSVLATGLCRVLLQDGYAPAPFKAQNMALNSYVTPEGLEIGRAQATQAEAAGIPCHTDMNPVLLKPSSDHSSQVVLNGRVIGNRDAYEYFRREGREELRTEVHKAFDRLSSRYHPIVLEGAGSVSELNLKDSDIVNMPMAMYADARVILVGDIDRGGVFASVYGSIMLMSPEERKHVCGIIINKFRGDLRLFDEGRRILEELCSVPVLGVVPYYRDIHIEGEDSVALAAKNEASAKGKVNVAVVMLRYLSNYTDFDVLERDERVHLYYTNDSEELQHADIIIVPGSKSTLADLRELRRNGAAQAIIRAHATGTTVFGICGGFQIMGGEISDPQHIEGDIERLPGLGLLPVTTVLTEAKVTRRTAFCFLDREEECTGYEIHMGRTLPVEGAVASPLNRLTDGTTDGYFADRSCMGTYLHGILDNTAVVDYLLAPFADKSPCQGSFDYARYREEQYNKLADHLRKHIDIGRIYKLMEDTEA